MLDFSYSVVISVLVPLRWAARRARCSIDCSGLHVLGLMRVSVGAAYVNFVLISVL